MPRAVEHGLHELFGQRTAADPVAARLHLQRPTGGPELMYIALSHESCDLDSVVSTLAIAYLRYRNPGTLQHNYMPVLNMLRRDYPSKSEVRFLLDKQHIKPDRHLVFRDDVPEELLLRSRFILVNHHVSPFHYCTEEVYDYRPYQCEAARLPIYCQRIMHPMRSCAALITERYDSPIYNYANVRCLRVFELLHAALLLQNSNYAQYTPEQLPNVRDYQLLVYLEKQLGQLDTPQRTILYDTLVSAMFDLNELTLPQILRREFKLLRANNGSHLVRIAQCCFPMAVTRFISFEFAQLAIQQFAAEHSCDFIMLLGTSMQPKGGLVIKELGLIPLDSLRDVEDRRLFDHMIINLSAAVEPLLALEPYRGLNFMQGAFFFINVWNVQFYDMLYLMQRVIYNWVSEDKFSPT
ncbi:exopolyphosphatase PRUNE1-like isoform X1 [Drosophila novamexicana]|uniref:exopolyphosphatase PRUNE1-like isoform X1 n=1 Tax=Drosophila novamexicana TaxID=47314 RepID=UPI0011E58C15|nr:exopolyphosphatase PRUNE1-like isoform X1 [Drosophila novamexicana]